VSTFYVHASTFGFTDDIIGEASSFFHTAQYQLCVICTAISIIILPTSACLISQNLFPKTQTVMLSLKRNFSFQDQGITVPFMYPLHKVQEMNI
jgi:hypothetical protein